MLDLRKNNPSAAFGVSSLYIREPFLFIYDLSIFLTSTAFVFTNAKYGIPLSRYTVFLQNCPLENSSKATPLFVWYVVLRGRGA